MSNSSQKDALRFLKEKPFKNFVVSMTRKDRYPQSLKPFMFALQNRILILHGLIKGYFSSKEAFLLNLPGRFKSEGLRVKFSKYTINEITSAARAHLKGFVSEDDSLDVYGHAFYPSQGNFGELVELLSQVCILDQYEAHEYLKDDSVVIDAGANIGSFSVFASNLKKNLTIYPFEPVKKTFEVLKKNVSPYKNIFPQHMGLGDVASRKKIFFSKDATVGSSFEDSNGSERSVASFDELSEEVDISTIDGFVKENGLPKVDFIKIDTEGYEANILKGAKETIKRFRPIITMSAYHKKEDRELLPQIIKSIRPDYEYKLTHAAEEDVIFYPKA